MDPFALTPEEEQRIAAEALRSQQVLGAAQQRGGRFDNLAAISQMINNKPAAEAAGLAQARAVARAKPAQLGNSGFMVDGQFAPNPGSLQDKLETRAQQRGLTAERLQASAESQRERLAAAAEQAAANRQLRKDLAGQTAALRMAVAASKGGGSGGGNEPPKGKALPFGAVEKLSKKEGVRDAYVDLTTTFKPEFAGTPAIAGLENLGGRFLPKLTGKGDQANWWQNYQEQTNLVRNQLFGSALTTTEKAAFDAQNIVPGMDAKEIERRLAQQAHIADKAYSKLVKAAAGSGYDTSGFAPDQVTTPAPKPGREAVGKVVDAPQGIDPAVWKHLTPEERKLWN